MGIFDDVVFNVRSRAEVFGRKANDVYDVQKLKWNLAELTREINKEYGILGKLFYDARKIGTDNDDNIENTIARIDSLFEQKNAIADRVLDLTDRKRCCACREIVPSSSNYCANCGERFEIPAPPVDLEDDETISF